MSTHDTRAFAQYTSALKNAETNPWSMTRLDKSYATADPNLNPIHQDGVIISWYDPKSSPDEAVTYICILTVFYETETAQMRAQKQLLKTIVDSIRQLMHKETGSESNEYSLPILAELLQGYASDEFQNAFGFGYQGPQSNPPNKKPNGRVVAYKGMFSSRNYPTVKADAEAWTSNEIFRRDGHNLPSFAQGQAYDDIVSQLVLYGGEGTPKTDNRWNVATFSKVYEDPSGSSTDIQQFAVYVYTLGEITYRQPTEGDDELATVRLMVIYYLSIFSSVVHV